MKPRSRITSLFVFALCELIVILCLCICVANLYSRVQTYKALNADLLIMLDNLTQRKPSISLAPRDPQYGSI